jgi:diguanylate cyclase (GGDEF)-like protein
MLSRRRASTFTGRLRRAVSPLYGARANAAEALGQIVEAGESRLRAGRLGTALWEAFPARVALLDGDGVVVSVNRAWRQFGLAYGGSAAPGLGSNYLSACHHAVTNGGANAEEAAEIVRAALAGDDAGGRLAYPCGDGGEDRWFSLQAIPIIGGHRGAVVVHSDLTAERQREMGWRHRALHDPLTGLANRALLSDRLEHAMAGAARDPDSLAVLFVDVVDFKNVNDTFGHPAGDEALRLFAATLGATVREMDVAARWGGEEFALVLPGTDADGGARLAERARAALEACVLRVEGRELRLTASFGVASMPPADGVEELVNAADAALYEAKRTGKNRVMV